MQSRLEVWGSEGWLDVDLLQGTGLRLFSKRGSPRDFAPPGWSPLLVDQAIDNGYPQELSHFLRCFAEGRTPEESGADGLAVLEILQAAYLSAARGQALELPFDAPLLERAVDPWLRR
jgi:predicted dehydrogenase